MISETLTARVERELEKKTLDRDALVKLSRDIDRMGATSLKKKLERRLFQEYNNELKTLSREMGVPVTFGMPDKNALDAIAENKDLQRSLAKVNQLAQKRIMDVVIQGMTNMRYNEKLEKYLEKAIWSEAKGYAYMERGKSPELYDMIKEKIKKGEIVSLGRYRYNVKDGKLLRRTLDTSPVKTIEQIKEDLQEVVGLTESRAEMIARTEVGAIQNAARLTSWKKMPAARNFRFKMININDRRTCDACKEVLAEQKEYPGLPLNDLLNLMETKSRKYYPSFTFRRYAPVMHYNSRSRISAYFG